MRKLLTGAILCMLISGISSCTINSSGTVTSNQFTVNAGQWTNSGGSGTSNFQYYFGYGMSSLTSNVVTNGAVLCYVNLGNQWAAMPYVETYSNYTRIYGYQYEVGTLYVTIKDSDLLTSAPSVNIKYKVVIVEEKNMPLLEGVNTNDYYAVENALQLEK